MRHGISTPAGSAARTTFRFRCILPMERVWRDASRSGFRSKRSAKRTRGSSGSCWCVRVPGFWCCSLRTRTTAPTRIAVPGAGFAVLSTSSRSRRKHDSERKKAGQAACCGFKIRPKAGEHRQIAAMLSDTSGRTKMDLNAKETNDVRLEWVEPTVQQLDVRETALNPFTGGDNPQHIRFYPDCTRS